MYFREPSGREALFSVRSSGSVISFLDLSATIRLALGQLDHHFLCFEAVSSKLCVCVVCLVATEVCDRAGEKLVPFSVCTVT